MYGLVSLVVLLLSSPSSASPILTYDQHEIEPFPHHETLNCYSLRNNKNATDSSVHCLPSIFLVGFPKCGTTALYGLLHLHPSILGTARKEYCIQGNDIVSYLKGLPSPEEVQGKILVSGCLLLETSRQIFELLKPKSVKAFIIVRDYAERAWAAYNFWCEPRIDAKCEKLGQWVTKDHYRSPEMFHELILAQHRQIALNLWFPTLLREAPRYYRDNIRQYADIIPPQDLHVIHSKELETSPEVVWEGIAKFLDHPLISPSAPHPKIKQFRSRRYNTQQHKGEASYQSSREYQSQLYPISGNRPMLPQTREILTEHWMPDCLWLKETYHFTTLEAC